MDRFEYRHVTLLRKGLTILNFIVVLYNASIFLLASKYISNNGFSGSFLNSLSYMPTSPQRIFFYSLLWFGLLSIIIHYRNKDTSSGLNTVLAYAEIILMIILIIELKGSYNGIILLVFADIVFNNKKIKHSFVLLLLCFSLLLVSDFSVLAKLINMPSIESYINFFPTVLKSIILLFRTIMTSLNIVIFIAFLVAFLLVQQKEKKHVSQELEMISQVNTELRNYAALTEKIGEDNERKRISREIHDTLGHALTGIAAGVDACIALIDIDTDKTKKQLNIVSQVVRQGIKDVRRSLYKLRPGALEDRTLKDGLIKMIEEFQSVSNIKIDLYYEWDRLDLENTKEDIIFRIIQESITNALRHGHATEVEVQMYVEQEHYVIVIQDNGTGCSEIKEGYGLKQMKERVAIINGNIVFSSDDGFRTMIEIPKNRGEEND